MENRLSPEIRDAITRVREINEKAPAPRGVFVQTFGCQQNEADSEKLRGMAEAMGYRSVACPEDADLILINTCAVREHAELRALSIIGNCMRLREQNPSLIVGVCGCMTAREKRVEQLRHGYPYVSFTLEPTALHRMPSVLLRVLLERRRRLHLYEDTGEIAEGLPVVRSARHRAWVSVMYGCNNFCTYCIVPYTRGRERSRASDAIVAEVRELVARGCRDITLLGQNVNSYQSDCDFAGLCEKLCAIEGDFLLRFMTSHPKDVSDRLIRVIAENPAHMAPHFHLPMQSGSDRILAGMNRRYTTAAYLETVEKLRAAVPHISLTSDIIVGFPGESEEDFLATCDMLRRVRFDMVYSFLYSPREGTPAAGMEEQIDDATRADRFDRLLTLANELALEANKPYEHTARRVLVDSESKNGGIYSGRTDTGKLVHFEATPADVGEFRTVYIDRADPYALHGHILTEK